MRSRSWACSTCDELILSAEPIAYPAPCAKCGGRAFDNLEDPPERNTVLGAGSWTWRLLGVLVGTATLISLVKSGFAIQLSGIPAKLYQNYIWLRDTLFEPLAWLLQNFELTIPLWLRDFIMAYALIAGAHWRTVLAPRNVSAVKNALGPKGGNELALAVLYSAIWPAVHGLLGFRVVLARGAGRWGYWMIYSLIYAGFLRQALRALVVTVVAAVLFFLWSYLVSIHGPGG